MASTVSRAGVRIRLTAERWAHIVAEHPELLPLHEAVLLTVANAERVVTASDGALIAIRLVASRKALVVVYRESSMHDGFIITAFVTTRLAALERRKQLWPPKN